MQGALRSRDVEVGARSSGELTILISKFREVQTAVAFLSGGLESQAPGGCAHITWVAGNAPAFPLVVVEMERLQPTLMGLTRRFPEAAVILDHNARITPAGGHSMPVSRFPTRQMLTPL